MAEHSSSFGTLVVAQALENLEASTGREEATVPREEDAADRCVPAQETHDQCEVLQTLPREGIKLGVTVVQDDDENAPSSFGSKRRALRANHGTYIDGHRASFTISLMMGQNRSNWGSAGGTIPKVSYQG